MPTAQTLKNIFTKHGAKFLWIIIIIYIAIFFIFCLIKYNAFGYNALDLGIYNQVFYNSTHSQLFHFTIHPHTYLGDHFEIFIVFLLPLYILWQSPLMLLLIQTIFLALTAWPLYLIAKEKIGRLYALFFSLLYLLNPLVQNSNAFEFHLLPFAVFLLAWTFYFYQKKKFPWFIVFSILSLTVREDVALVIVMFSALAWLDKRSWRWRIAPAVLGLGWFLAAMKIISYLNHYGQYKFFYYYQWLGTNWSEVLTNLATKPWLIFQHLFSVENGALILVLLMLFAGLPLLRPKLLLLGIFPLGQLLFAGFSKTLAVETHYASLLIIPLFLASIKGFSRISNAKKTIIAVILLAIGVYSTATLGPLFGLPKLWKNHQAQGELVNIKNQFVRQVPSQAPLVTTYEFLTKLSGRPEIYSLHYVFRGTKQYSDEKYILPEDIDYALIDFHDFLVYQSQYSERDFYHQGDERVNLALKDRNLGLKKIIDTVSIWQRDYPSSIKLYELMTSATIENKQEVNLDNKIKFLGFSSPEIKSEDSISILNISFYWQAIERAVEKNYQIQIDYLDGQDQTLYQRFFPLGYGLFPTAKWPANEIIKTNQWLYVPRNDVGKLKSLKISLVDIKGYLGLNKIKSAEIKTTKKEIIGEPFIIHL